jgi:RNA polymerase sigma-70 factor (ECF subfamily)
VDPWGSRKLLVTLARMGDPQFDDEEITELALASRVGDRAALATFVRATQRDVYRFLTQLCERDEVEGLTRETYLRAVRALPGFAGRSSARAWLLSIARRVASDQVRGTVVRPRTRVKDWDTVVSGNPAHRRSDFDDAVLLRELVARLESDRRDAFVLTQMLGLGYAAAAEVCGCPVGTIRSRVARAREDLVRAMNALDPPGPNATGPSVS